MPNYAVQRRRGTTAEHSSFTGLSGELTVDTSKDVVIVHDGSTAGGIPMMAEDGSNFSGGTIATQAWVTSAVQGEDTLAEMNDVSLVSAASADILTYNGNAWVDVALSGDATMTNEGVVSVTGITVADTTDTTCFVGLWESATGDLGPKTDGAITYDAGTGALSATTFVGALTGAVTGNADTATSAAGWTTSRTLSFTGDVTGSGSVDGTGNVATALTIAADSVALGADTTGNYVLSIADAGSSNITVVNGSAEGGAVTLDTAQDIGTGDSPTFVGLTLTGDLTVQGTTTTVDSTTVSIADTMIQLASGNSGASAAYIGMQAERGATDAYFVWEESTDRWRATTSADGSTHSDADMQCGTLNGTATAAQYSDLAERYETDQMYAAGTVVCFGGSAEITESTELYDSKVAGVISTNPAHLMNAQAGTNETHPAVALTGRVPCKVMGTVRKGDLMVTSARSGVAMSADERVPGTIIGKAIQDYTDDGIGVIEILVTLM